MFLKTSWLTVAKPQESEISFINHGRILDHSWKFCFICFMPAEMLNQRFQLYIMSRCCIHIKSHLWICFSFMPWIENMFHLIRPHDEDIWPQHNMSVVACTYCTVWSNIPDEKSHGRIFIRFSDLCDRIGSLDHSCFLLERHTLSLSCAIVMSAETTMVTGM